MKPAPQSPLTIERTALEQLAALLLERAGLKITPDGYYGLRLALQARMPALGVDDASEYVRRLRQWAGEAELRSLLPLVTVGKTEFFRDHRQFSALQKVLLPEMLERARRERRAVKAWSAGCATGEEPYSVAMVAQELGAKTGEVDVWATDLNPLAVARAAEGVFAVRRMVGVSEQRLERFFVHKGQFYEASRALKAMVRFEGHNLAAPVFPGVVPGSLDLIMCRNVIIYFDEATIRGLMGRFHDALREGGVLLLGYSESLFQLSQQLDMQEIEEAFIYRRSPKHKPPPPKPAVVAPRPSSPPWAPRPAASLADASVAITAKIPIMPLPASKPAEKPVAQAAMGPAERLHAVGTLLHKGDFAQALLVARRLTDEHPDDLASLLTLGNVHAVMGNVDEAEDVLKSALAKEPLCVEARLYLALAAMQQRNFATAKVELTRAIFLEPNLALAHYLSGQVHEKLGDNESARRGYRNAAQLKKVSSRPLLGHYPELPHTGEAIAQAAQYRLAALAER
ncbi:MAG: tetratricopeptide repeat protein [Myxococcaceae bacterium]|nr:tetratricopeptide repeat protein [Myxococcaceae bacterium]